MEREVNRETDTCVMGQYQKAQDAPLPFAQRHGPEVPEKPQACAAWHDEGAGKSGESYGGGGVRDKADNQVEGGEGWQARCCVSVRPGTAMQKTMALRI